MVRPGLLRLRETVKQDPLATMFGGDEDIALCVLRVRPELARRSISAADLLAVALGGKPSGASVPDDIPDDTAMQLIEERFRQAPTTVEAARASNCESAVVAVFGSREVAIAFLIRPKAEHEAAIETLVSDVTAMHNEIAALMGGSSHLAIERL